MGTGSTTGNFQLSSRKIYKRNVFRAVKKAHQLDKVLGHFLIVLIDGVHNSVDQRLLVLLRHLRHIAKVHVRDAAVPQSKNVARVRIPVEQPKLHTP